MSTQKINPDSVIGKEVILRAILYRREQGTEKWIIDEEKRYICPVGVTANCSAGLPGAADVEGRLILTDL